MFREYKDANMVSEKAYKMAGDALLNAINSLEQSLSDPSNLKDVFENEALVDNIKIEYAEKIISCKISPSLINDRLSIMWKIDGALDEAVRFARNITVFYSALGAKEINDLKIIFQPVKETSLLIVEALSSLFVSFEDTKELLQKVEEKRDENSELIYSLKKYHFDSADDWKSFIAFNELSSRIRALQDKIESIGERINTILAKYLI